MTINSQKKSNDISHQANPQSANQFQSFVDISFSGSGNNFHPINSAEDVNIDQSQTQTIGQSSNTIDIALAELEKLKQEIYATNSLSLIQKK